MRPHLTIFLALSFEVLAGEAAAQRNFRPVFTSSNSATTSENNSGIVYEASASDRNGDPLVFSIAGGIDAARFSLTAAGHLSFVTPPDFEAPADSGRDNNYRVTLRVEDGRGGASSRLLRVSVTDLSPEGIQVRRRGTGFTLPLFVTGAGDGSGRLFVVEKQGLIRILNPETGAVYPTPFLDIGALITTQNERGLLGLAFAPDYATSGIFYVNIATSAGPTQIRRYSVSSDPDVADSSSGDAVYSFAHPSGNHRAGWIGFGPDGFLYVASGDGDAAIDPSNPAQDVNSPLGKVLRLDVSGDDFPADPERDYKIPPGNPFAGGGGLPEIFALGLRNPYRASFDAATGALLIGDVGEDLREEIDLIGAGDAGRNFGWVRFEGTFVLVPTASAPNATPPVLEYLHGSGAFEGNSIIGGVVNRGPVSDLGGHYIFGDFVSRNIWSLPVASFQQGTTLQTNALTRQTDAFVPDVGTIDGISSFGTDDAGNVYIVDLFGGEIFRFERE